MEPSMEGSEEPPSSPIKKKVIVNKGAVNQNGSFLMLLKSLPDYSPYLKNLRIEIISETERCRELWQEFSPKKTLFDTWEFRLAFNKAYQFKPHFILIGNQFENLALLPLEYNQDEREYHWFGSSWQEENKFFSKNPIFIPFLLAIAPKPLYLNAIDFTTANELSRFLDFQPDQPKYILDLTNLKSREDFLMSLTKNKRHDLRKDKRRIERQNPKIIINEVPTFSDLDTLINLSKERFSQKGEVTDWEDPRRIEAFRQVILLSNQSYKLRLIKVEINQKVAGVDLVAIFNNCYYTLKCGYDIKNFSGIGNFINLFEIEEAIKMGMKRVDFLQNSYQWKNRWFTALPLLKYEPKN